MNIELDHNMVHTTRVTLRDLHDTISSVSGHFDRLELRDWADDLEQTGFGQTTYVLRDADGGYCCLGIYAHMIGYDDDRITGETLLDDIGTTLPGGISTDPFTELNDSLGASFSDIAALIRHALGQLPDLNIKFRGLDPIPVDELISRKPLNIDWDKAGDTPDD